MQELLNSIFPHTSCFIYKTEIIIKYIKRLVISPYTLAKIVVKLTSMIQF